MPFALIIIGVVLVTAAVRDTTSGDNGLYTLVKNDFSGPDNFMYWLASILIIGAIGYVKPLTGLSRMFLVLVLVVLFLKHGGVFEGFNKQLFTSTPNTQRSSMASGNQ